MQDQVNGDENLQAEPPLQHYQLARDRPRRTNVKPPANSMIMRCCFILYMLLNRLNSLNQAYMRKQSEAQRVNNGSKQ